MWKTLVVILGILAGCKPDVSPHLRRCQRKYGNAKKRTTGENQSPDIVAESGCVKLASLVGPSRSYEPRSYVQFDRIDTEFGP